MKCFAILRFLLSMVQNYLFSMEKAKNVKAKDSYMRTFLTFLYCKMHDKNLILEFSEPYGNIFRS